MRKMILSVVASTFLAAGTHAAVTFDWGYTADLAVPLPTVQVGYFVQMYQDANSNGVAGVTFSQTTGTPGGTGAGDVLLGSFTSSVQKPKTSFVWSELALNGDSIAGYSVYTVIFDANAIASATNAVIIDASPHIMVSDGIDSYTMGSVSGGWQALVPEPGTFALLGMGLVALGARSRFRKEKK